MSLDTLPRITVKFDLALFGKLKPTSKTQDIGFRASNKWANAASVFFKATKGIRAEHHLKRFGTDGKTVRPAEETFSTHPLTDVDAAAFAMQSVPGVREVTVERTP